MRKLLFFILFISMACLKSHGQNSYILKTADKFYTQQNYIEAIAFYEKLLLNESANETTLKKLAISYLKIKKYKQAELTLNTLTNKYPLTEESASLYASVLASNGNYEQAKKYYKIVTEINPSNSAANQFLKTYESLSLLLKDSIFFRLNYLSLNTPNAEFSPAFYKDKLLFVSSRKKEASVKRVYEYDNSPFLDLFLVDTSKLSYRPVSNKLQYQSEETSTIINAQKKLHESITKETSNDNAITGNYHPNLKNDPSKETDKKNGILPFQKNLATSFHEGPSVFSIHQDSLYFTSNNTAQRRNSKKLNTLKIYLASVNEKGEFSNPTPLPFCSGDYSVAYPALTKKGNTLYFSSNMPGGAGGFDLYKSERIHGKWSTPLNIKELNTQGNEVFPFIDQNNQLFYSSDGNGGLGGLDIFIVSLEELTSPKNIGYPLNSSKDDFGILMYENGQRGYVSSNRSDNGGDDNIYYFTAEKPFTTEPKKTPLDTIPLSLKGILKEKGTNHPVQTMVALFEKTENNLVNIAYSDDQGNFNLSLDKEKKYILKIADVHYYIVTDTISTISVSNSLEKKYELEKNIAISNADSIKESWKPYVSKSIINGKVVDDADESPLDAIVKISSLTDSSNVFMTIADFDGTFSSSLPYEGYYSIDILMEGYSWSNTVVDINKSSPKQFVFPLHKIKNDYDSLQKIWTSKKTKGTLKGSIYAEPNNEPLSNIVVLFPEKDTLLEEYTISDFEGHFSMKIKKGVDYNLLVQDPQRGEIHKKINLNENDTVLYQLITYKENIRPEKINLDSVIKAYSEQDKQHNFKYGAKIVDKETKEPLDALIAIQTSPEGSPDEVTASDFEGNFTFRIRKQKNYYLTFVSKEYETSSITINSKDSLYLPKIIELKKQKENRKTDSLITIYKAKLKEKSTLIGSITTQEEDQPVMAFVALFKEGESTPYDVLPADEMGKFSFSLKKNELYKIEIMETGYLPIQEYLNTADTNTLFRRDFKLKKPIKKEIYDSLNLQWKEQSVNLKLEKPIPSATTAIKGYVFETETNSPLQAKIKVINTANNQWVLDTITNEDGKYYLPVPVNTTYKLIFEAEHHFSDSTIIKATEATKSRQSIFFLKKASILAVQKKNNLLKTIPLNGTILESKTNKPIQTAIGIFKSGEEKIRDLIYSDATGKYVTQLSTETNYTLKIVNPGYVVVNDLISTKNSLGKPIVRNYVLVKNDSSLTSDSIASSIRKNISKFLLHGKVIDSLTNVPVEAIVKITPPMGASETISVTSPHGFFTSPLQGNGKYKVEILNENYLPLTRFVEVNEEATNAIFPLIKIHKEYEAIKKLWTKKIKGRFEGTITEFPSEPLSDFVILFEEGDTILNNYTLSDLEGKFSIPVKKETTYHALIQDTKYGDKLDQVKIALKDSVLTRSYFFKKGITPKKIDFDSLAKSYYQQNQLYNINYQALLLDSKSRHPVDAFIAIQEISDTIPDEVLVSDELGSFSIHIRKHKSYLLTIVSENYRTKTVQINSDSSMPETIWMEKLPQSIVTDSMLTLYKTQLDKKIMVTGIVRDEITQKPLKAFVAVNKKGETKPMIASQADPDGYFSFTLTPKENYSIQIVEPGYAPSIYYVKANDIEKSYCLDVVLTKQRILQQYDSTLTSWKKQKDLLTSKSPSSKKKATTPLPSNKKMVLEASSNGQKKVLYGILFEVNKATLSTKQKNYLQPLISTLLADSTALLSITGHADFTGIDSSNLILSERRAEALKTFLVSEKIAAERINYVGLGEQEPLVENKSVLSKQINRRVSYSLTGKSEDSTLFLYQTGIRMMIPIQHFLNGENSAKIIRLIPELLSENPSLSLVIEVSSSKKETTNDLVKQLHSLLNHSKIGPYADRIIFIGLKNNSSLKEKALVELFLRAH